jgi:hypothetical protein
LRSAQGPLASLRKFFLLIFSKPLGALLNQKLTLFAEL